MFRSLPKAGAALIATICLSGTLAAEDRLAEDQSPSGKFLTATEVKPILTATKANWIAVREWQGQDLIYFTHLLSWRCGLYEIRYSVNGGPQQLWPIPECDPVTHSVGLIPEGTEIYTTLPLQSVASVEIEVLYDDLTTDVSAYERAAVLMP
ncbi:hypothetical protein NBRC116601_24390 [Cognatishimia sp. WU-CL00825]|uniref:hypothetical protein n=1 Tax=Cognatishimia sp. WU-CL00825 TaxID=3127658 RepID=UPI0031054CFE